MGIIELYILFCLTTAISGAIIIYRQVHIKLGNSCPNHIVIKSPILATIIFIIFGTIAAPVLFWILVSSSTTEEFIDNMCKGINT